MLLGDASLLADQNVAFVAVDSLRQRGLNIVRTDEIGLARAGDAEVLQEAIRTKMIVLTHDSDFGALAISQGAEVFGIVYIRPGALTPSQVVEAVIQLRTYEVETPFLLVARVSKNLVSVRYRPLKAV